ncbi:MAG: PD-(D/E)XK nuclease family protein, partial [Clostridia bacterium]|nr:PD-(D/E)XK nuclease family protein [Clostridia bacterium]
VDSNGKAFIILDYKTFKGASLSASDIYHGEKLQLYIYAKAMKDNTKQDIAGVFYLPIYAGFNKDDEKRYSYEGQVTRNAELRNEIYGELPEGVESSFIQDTVLPQPKTTPAVANTYLDEEGFDARCRYAIDLAVEGVKEIEGGYISPRPVCECANCDFKKVCTYAEVGARERYSVDPSIFVEYDKNDNALRDGGDK